MQTIVHPIILSGGFVLENFSFGMWTLGHFFGMVYGVFGKSSHGMGQRAIKTVSTAARYTGK